MLENEAGTDAPVVDNTATPPAPAPISAENSNPDTQAEVKEDEAAVKRTYSEEEMQDRIERATAKAAAKAERRAYREALETLGRNQPPAVQPQTDTRPTRRPGEADDDYLERLTDWKLEQRDRASTNQKVQEHQRSMNEKTENIYAEAEKIPGFDRDDFNALPLTPAIAQAITESDVAARLMHYMSTNPADVSRISKLSPVKQAAEIGKLEARLAVSTPSKAAPPITPIGQRGASQKSLEEANMDEYIAMRRKQGASWAR